MGSDRVSGVHRNMTARGTLYILFVVYYIACSIVGGRPLKL